MSLAIIEFGAKSRLRALLDHFSIIADPREPWRVAHPLPEVLLLGVCGTIADCDDHESIADWGEHHLGFLRRGLPWYHGGSPGRARGLARERRRPRRVSVRFSARVYRV